MVDQSSASHVRASSRLKSLPSKLECILQTSITVHFQIAEAELLNQRMTEAQLLGYLGSVLTDRNEPDSVPSLFSAETMSELGLPEVTSVSVSRNGIEFASFSA